VCFLRQAVGWGCQLRISGNGRTVPSETGVEVRSGLDLPIVERCQLTFDKGPFFGPNTEKVLRLYSEQGTLRVQALNKVSPVRQSGFVIRGEKREEKEKREEEQERKRKRKVREK
jgi:hypothetical protein